MLKYRIQNMADTQKGIIWLHGVIGSYEDNLQSLDIARVLNEMDSNGIQNITVHINSPGGYVFDGLAIYNALSERNVEVIIDGLAASIASVIACAGKTVRMYKNAFFMIHNPWTFVIGDETYMKKVAKELAMIKESIMSAYIDRTGLDADALAAMMTEETWLNADDSLENGWCDEIINKKSAVDTEQAKNQFFNLLQSGEFMDRQYLIQLLGLKKDATDEDIKNALQALKQNAEQVENLMETVSNLQEQLNSAPSGEGADDSVAELQARINTLQETVDTLINANRGSEAERVVDEAIAQGKIFPGQKQTFVDSATTDLEKFKAAVKDMPKLFDPDKKLHTPQPKDLQPKPGEYKSGEAADYIRGLMTGVN